MKEKTVMFKRKNGNNHLEILEIKTTSINLHKWTLIVRVKVDFL